MSFEQWLTANGYDAEALKQPENANQRKHLEAAWKAETQQPAKIEPAASTFEQEMEAIRREDERVNRIQKLTKEAMASAVGNTTKIERFRALCDTAISEKWAMQQFEIAMLREERSVAPMVLTPQKQIVTDETLEAAVCIHANLENIDKQFDAKTLEVASRTFKGGLTIAGLITQCARAAGYSGHDFKSNWLTAVKFAFQGKPASHEMYASETSPSTYSLPNILGNIANKFLRQGFMSVDDAWRMIAARRSFNDFKQTTTVGLTGSLMYSKLNPSGEIVDGNVGEVVYNNQADTYAVKLGIGRRDLINDDVGALTSAGRRLGRGAALSLNDTFWTVFLNNSSFFTSGNNNVATGAGSALSLTSLGDADRIFRLQTDPDGKPLGIMPRILLVPTAIRITALNLMNSTIVVATNTGTTTTLSPNSNVLAGAYTVVSSPYMSNTAYTGNSTTAWYLLADPNDLPTIEVGFLNGQEAPTVETQAAEFNSLGIAMRGYYDYGCALQEFRAGVRSAGA